METLYHYTDINAFFNIVKNKKLWISATNNLNDYQEIKWFNAKLHKKINRIATKENHKLINGFQELWRINQITPYICSFSKDGDVLSQWRAYADDGHGVAIGFNKDNFGISPQIPSRNASSKLSTGIFEAIYDESIQNKLIDEIIELITSSADKKDTRLIEACFLANKLSCICKNPAFKEENEVRIIHTPTILGDASGATVIHGGISDLNYRQSGKKLTSYFDLTFEEKNNNHPIQKIVLGPKCELNFFDAELFLSLNGFKKIHLRKSNASYR